MNTRLPEGERRRRGAQATRDRFFAQPFDWEKGVHCVKLAHAHLRNMGKRPPKLPIVRSPEEARAAMTERGWDSVAAMLDALLERIPPAMMRTGDIAIVDGDEGFESVLIYLGPRKLMGWLPTDLRAVVGFDEDGAPITRGGVAIYDTSLENLKSAWRALGAAPHGVGARVRASPAAKLRLGPAVGRDEVPAGNPDAVTRPDDVKNAPVVANGKAKGGTGAGAKVSR